MRENSSFTDAPSLCVPMRDRLQAAASRTRAATRQLLASHLSISSLTPVEDCQRDVHLGRWSEFSKDVVSKRNGARLNDCAAAVLAALRVVGRQIHAQVRIYFSVTERCQDVEQAVILQSNEGSKCRIAASQHCMTMLSPLANVLLPRNPPSNARGDCIDHKQFALHQLASALDCRTYCCRI